MRCSIIFVLLAIIFGRTLSMYSGVGSVQNGRIEVESEEDVLQLGGYFCGDLKPVLDYLAILEGRVAQQSEEAASKLALVDETLEALRTQRVAEQLENISQASAILSIIGEVDEKLETLKTQMATQEQLEKNSQRSEDALSKIVLMDEKLETLRTQMATHHEVEKSSKQSEDALSKIVLMDEKLETLRTQMATQEQLEKNSQQSVDALSKIVLVDEKLETLRNQTATHHEVEKSSKQSEDALSKIVLGDEKLETLKTEMPTQEQLEKNSQQSEDALSKIVLVDEKLETLRNQTATKQELERTKQSADTLSKMAQVEKKLEALEGRMAASQRSLQKLLHFQFIGSKYYYIEHQSEKSWQDALKECREMGAHLASLQSETEREALEKVVDRSKRYWIDLNDLKKQGEFISATTGLKGTFFNWIEDEPNNQFGSENCVELRFPDGRMNDIPCDFPINFICETSWD